MNTKPTNTASTVRPNSRIAQFCSSLKAKERKAVLKMLDDKRIPSTAVAKILTENGCPVAHGTVRKYRCAVAKG